MAIIPFSNEFYALLYITIMLIIVKITLSVLLIRKAIFAKKEGLQSYQFVFSIALLMMSLAVSRIIFIVFDFELTKFDMSLYTQNLNVWVWKIGCVFANLGLIPISYILDKRIMQGKFKGIPALWISIGTLIFLLYPANNVQDFHILSTIYFVSAIGAFVIPAIFIKMIRDTTGSLRTYSILFFIGVLLYILAAFVVNAAVLTRINEITGQELDVFLYLLQAIFKMIGLTLFSYATTKLAV